MTGVSMGLPIIIFSLVLAKILNGRRKKVINDKPDEYYKSLRLKQEAPRL
jgi:hypothetical protein